MIILGIILFLIFYPKLSQQTDFAKSINLNCPREITFELGDEIILPKDYISIDPSSMIDELEISVYTKSSKTNPENVNINNNIISAKATGFYYIKHIVPGKKYDIHDTL